MGRDEKDHEMRKNTIYIIYHIKGNSIKERNYGISYCCKRPPLVLSNLEIGDIRLSDGLLIVPLYKIIIISMNSNNKILERIPYSEIQIQDFSYIHTFIIYINIDR